VHPGRGDGQGRRILAIDINPDKFEMAKALGATDFINPREVNGSVVETIRDLTVACRLLVRVHRQRQRDARRARMHPHGLGRATVIGVAGAGQEICTRPFNLVVGRTWKGTAFGGVKGAASCRATSTTTWPARSSSTNWSPTPCRWKTSTARST